MQRCCHSERPHRHGRLRSILVLLCRRVALAARADPVLPAQRALTRVSEQAHQRLPAGPAPRPTHSPSCPRRLSTPRCAARSRTTSIGRRTCLRRHNWGLGTGVLDHVTKHKPARAPQGGNGANKGASNKQPQRSSPAWQNHATSMLGRACCGRCCPGAAALSPPAAPRPRRVAAQSARCFASCRGNTVRVICVSMAAQKMILQALQRRSGALKVWQTYQASRRRGRRPPPSVRRA